MSSSPPAVRGNAARRAERLQGTRRASPVEPTASAAPPIAPAFRQGQAAGLLATQGSKEIVVSSGRSLGLELSLERRPPLVRSIAALSADFWQRQGVEVGYSLLAIDGIPLDQWGDQAIARRLEERPLRLTFKREVSYFSPKDGVVARMAKHQQTDIEELASAASKAEKDTDRAVEELKNLRHFAQEDANMVLWREKVDMQRQWVKQAEKAAMFSEHLQILDTSNRGKPWTDYDAPNLRYEDHFCSPASLAEPGPDSEDALALANRILLGLRSEAPLRVVNKQTTNKAMASLRSEMHALNVETAEVAARIQGFRQVKTDWIGSEPSPPKPPEPEKEDEPASHHRSKDDSESSSDSDSDTDSDSPSEGSNSSGGDSGDRAKDPEEEEEGADSDEKKGKISSDDEEDSARSSSDLSSSILASSSSGDSRKSYSY